MILLDDIKKDLIRTDCRLINQITRIPTSTIWAYLNGNRNNKTEQGQLVLSTAKKIIENRKELLK